MNETTNNATRVACHYGDELRGAYSNSIRNHKDIISRVRQNCGNTWGDPKGADAQSGDTRMRDWIFSNMKFSNSDMAEKASLIVSTLEDEGYHREKVVSQMDTAVQRLKASHAPSPISKPSYRECLEQVRRFVRPSYVMVRFEFQNLQELQAALTNPQASVGFAGTYMPIRKKGEVNEQMFDVLKRRVEWAIENGTFAEPTQVAARIQLSVPIAEGELLLKETDDGKMIVDYKQKTRLVNVVSLVEIFAQMQFSQSIQLYFGGVDWYAGGKTSDELRKVINNNRGKYFYWVSIDYSAYDQSLPGWLIKDCFSIMKEWFRLSEEDEKLWDVMCHDAIHKDIIVDKQGTLVRVHDGVRSGEMLTSVIDSLSNLIMLWYYAMLNGKQYGRDWVANICGDDNLDFHTGWFDQHDYAVFIDKIFGVTCHPLKCAHGTRFDDPEYLSRVWKSRGVWRDPMEILVKLIWHEYHREYDGPKAVDPAMVIAAYDQSYPLGMLELFDMEEFYRRFPRWTASKMSMEDAKSLTGMTYFMVMEQRKREGSIAFRVA